jgi:hypothetical protein
MAIILKANKVSLFVSSVLFVFWYQSPNFLDTSRVCMYVCQTTGCHVRTSGAGTSVRSELTKAAFRQPQVLMFPQNHAIQHCRLKPLPDHNRCHHQSASPRGDSYELRSEGVLGTASAVFEVFCVVFFSPFLQSLQP